jgi:hypothetical protein
MTLNIKATALGAIGNQVLRVSNHRVGRCGIYAKAPASVVLHPINEHPVEYGGQRALMLGLCFTRFVQDGE